MYAKSRVIEDAFQLFDKMQQRDLVTWTVLIGAYAVCGNANESLVLFDWVEEEGVVLDKVAVLCIRLELFMTIYVGNKFSLDVILGTAMIDMYVKCGNVDSARGIFDRMQEKNVISWSAMIAAYGYHGQGWKAFVIFPVMLGCWILPNRITFVSLLYASCRAGSVEEGLQLFSLMWDDYAGRPDVKHYTCMVDLLGCAGRLDEALKLIENITVEKDEGLWRALLGPFRIHGRIDLAEKAANLLLELQPQNPGHYVLLSNIYSKAGKGKDVANIGDLMMQRRLKKVPGWTWIKVDEKIYQFSVGDKTHVRSKEIYGMLKSLRKKLELASHFPCTHFVLHDMLGILYTHSEKLAISFGLIATPKGTPIRITKNLRVCGDYHTFIKLVSAITKRDITVRDSNRFHLFKERVYSCGDY